jgi:hypothetical protein
VAFNDHLTKVIADTCAEASREMWARIEGEISEKDELAIASALTKVATESARLATLEVVAQVTESTPQVTMTTEFTIIDHDPWAERYGESG